MIVVLETIEPAALDILKSFDEVRHLPSSSERTEELEEALPRARALIVRNRTRVTHALLRDAGELEVVGRLGTGLDNLDLRAIRERGLTLVTGEGANAVAVAEWVLGYLFYISKPFAQADASIRAANWDRSLGGRELCGKTIGIVGLGHVGRSLAKRCAALGMRVITTLPHLSQDGPAFRLEDIEAFSLPDLLPQSDVISVHVPLVSATRRLFGQETFSRMKRGVLFIQTSRGGVVDEAALARALRSGRVGGALVDVFSDEPPDPTNPLFAAPNCILTPHVAGLAEEARMRVDMGVAQGVILALRRAGSLKEAL